MVLVGCFCRLFWCKIVPFTSVYGVSDIGLRKTSETEIAIFAVRYGAKSEKCWSYLMVLWRLNWHSMVVNHSDAECGQKSGILAVITSAVASCTVRLLTHVHCKPTHFFFPSFIATMAYSLQTSFDSVMKDWADKFHLWGTPTRSPSRSNSR